MDLVSRWHVTVDDLAIDHTNDPVAASSITRLLLVRIPTPVQLVLKLMAVPSPSSGLMGVGIASTIVKNVRNDYNHSWSWLGADSPLDVLAYLHCTVRFMPMTHFPSGGRI